MSASATLLAQIPWLQQQNLTDQQMHTVQLLAGYGLGAVAGLGMLYIFSKTAPDGGLKLSFLDVPIGLGCFALAFPVVMLASIAGVHLHRELAGSDPDAIAHPILQQIADAPGQPWTWALIAAVVLGAPLFEELLFRVFGQSALLKVFKSPWISIILAGLAFGLSHRLLAREDTGVPWHAVLPITMLGICCGVAYERTRRVGVPITMHVCFNAINIILATTQHA
jgi:membrane protease YdiL (CAAX protease family)